MKYEGRNSYHDMTSVKVFADKQTDGRTYGRAEQYMPPIYRCGGIKYCYTSPTIQKFTNLIVCKLAKKIKQFVKIYLLWKPAEKLIIVVFFAVNTTCSSVKRSLSL